ncbi:UbiA prenyltransferase family [Apiospora rasikravindrae]|uniref:UbiA prenyltransferase family n=1 Tax=Apiospora rasikravindrae TaxID=990691 RepID=A0ABR1U178_9PEZI
MSEFLFMCGHLLLACLIAACISWTMIYDTIYAWLDLKEDKKLQLGSSAVLFERHLKPALSLLPGIALVCLGLVD